MLRMGRGVERWRGLTVSDSLQWGIWEREGLTCGWELWEFLVARRGGTRVVCGWSGR